MQTFRRCAGVQEALRRNKIGSAAYGTCAWCREDMTLARRSTPGLLNLGSTFRPHQSRKYFSPRHVLNYSIVDHPTFTQGKEEK